MSAMHKLYKATITTLTPLHIGTGTRLLKDYDFVSRNGKTWVINNDELAEQLGDPEDPGFQELMRAKPVDLLREDDYSTGNPLWRYVLSGVITANEAGSELQETIKNPWDQPYVPGSSLKGALRTALAYSLWPEGKPVPYDRIRAAKVKQAAEPMEELILYGNQARPHFDLLRALHVADSRPDEDKRMHIGNVKVVTGEKPQSPVALEVVSSDVVFETTITLDLNLLARAGELGWNTDQTWALESFRTMVNGHTQERIRRFQATKWKNAPPHLKHWYIDLFQRVSQIEADETGFITQLGWGGGWDSKTFGAILTSDESEFYALVGKFSAMDRKGTYTKGDLYPKSRRVTIVNDKLGWPLGWIEVKLEAQS